MEIENYIELLKQDKGTSSHIEMDLNGEIKYMNLHKSGFKRVINAIPRLSNPIRILDIGPTPFTIFIKKEFPNYEVWALDRTNLMEERLNQSNVKFMLCNLDVSSIPFEDEYFDIIIFTEVLEHVFEPPSNVLKELKRILRTSGKMIIGVPNIASLSKRIKLLFGISPLQNADMQMQKGWVHGHGHIHEYTKKELLSLCNLVNLKISYVRMTSTNLYEILRAKKDFKLLSSILLVLYYCIIYFFPPFRPFIHIECRKY